MPTQSLLESIIEHDSDKLLVYGAIFIAVAVGGLLGTGIAWMYLVPLFLVIGFLGIVGYYYRQTVHSG